MPTDASMILYDKNWNPIKESANHFTHVPAEGTDTLATLEIAADVARGEYILAVQVDYRVGLRLDTSSLAIRRQIWFEPQRVVRCRLGAPRLRIGIIAKSPPAS